MDKDRLDRIIRPQLQIDLIFSVNFIQEIIDVRPTVVFDLDEPRKRIILAQTSPSASRSMEGREVEATFLTRDDESGELKRLGYQTTVLEFLPEYSLREGVVEQALAIGYPQEALKETSVRLHYRVSPGGAHQVSVAIPDSTVEINLLDLSLGGMLLSYRGRLDLRQGQRLSLILTIQDTVIPVMGEAVRLFDREGSKLLFVGIKFTEMETRAARVLQETVSGIMREDLKNRSGLGGEGR